MTATEYRQKYDALCAKHSAEKEALREEYLKDNDYNQYVGKNVAIKDGSLFDMRVHVIGLTVQGEFIKLNGRVLRKNGTIGRRLTEFYVSHHPGMYIEVC